MRDYYHITEAAKLLNTSESKLREEARNNKLPLAKYLGTLWIEKSLVNKLVEEAQNEQ